MPITVEEDLESEINRLAALQEADQRLKAQQEHVTALRSEADRFEAEMERQWTTIAGLTTEHDGLEAQRADMDAQLEAEGGKIRDSRMRMNRVRNDRELLALQREVNLSKEANLQLEEALITVMESLEGLSSQISAAREVLEGLEKQREVEVAQRRTEAEALGEGVSAEQDRREALVQGMSASLRSKYEQIFHRRGGTAVVEARQGTCQGCHMNVPPQLFNELQRSRAIHQCPSCHRILYWRPESAVYTSSSNDGGPR